MLLDRATVVTAGGSLALEPLVEGDPILLNVISTIPLNPARVPGVDGSPAGPRRYGATGGARRSPRRALREQPGLAEHSAWADHSGSDAATDEWHVSACGGNNGCVLGTVD
jgi:hypothetical protein